MINCVTELGFFFKNSPKRGRVLEAMIVEENKGRDDKINKTKVKVFCETRWIERHVVLEEVQLFCEPILKKSWRKFQVKKDGIAKQWTKHMVLQRT